MKGDCYLELAEVFYNNLKVINGDIHSHVKGVDIVVNVDVWLLVAGLKAEGCMSHMQDLLHKKWTTKKQIYKDCLRYAGRLSTEDLFLLNAIQTKIPTNWVVVFKKHMIDIGINDAYNLPYGVFISKVLKLHQVVLTDETIGVYNKTNEIGKTIPTCIDKMNELMKNYVEISSSIEGSEEGDESSEEDPMDKSSSMEI
ncbi:hypothetical protein LR48_Vigan04g087100 [Vigna angularis]|uniref:Uncharacterized protein n=1 Tax=Phaseolus angularis TaxID=3914 RepID=A0A0L9UD36_PHAAN|nr:hypothetical protein LR48_Vigan04g087100 [Vigna angularis]